jgi:hypothetical protein
MVRQVIESSHSNMYFIDVRFEKERSDPVKQAMEYKQVGAFEIGGNVMIANSRDLTTEHSLRPYEAL